MPRLVAVGRDFGERVKLFNLRDVPCDRLRRNQISIAECRFLSQAIEVTFKAVALDASDGARVSRVLISARGFLNGERVFVGAGRDLSRRVGHRGSVTLCSA